MTARLLYLFSILFLASQSCPGSAGEAELNLVRQEVQAAREEAGLEEQPSLGKPITAADRVFSVPERENRVAEAIADIVVAGRQGADSEESKVWEARSSLDDVLSLLSNLSDPRVVRLVAPLLAENGTFVSVGNKAGTPAQNLAARTLWELGMNGEIDIGDVQTVPAVEDLRRWWKENRDKYGPVPQPLRALSHEPVVTESSAPVVPNHQPSGVPVGPSTSPIPRWSERWVPILIVSGILLGVVAFEMARRQKIKVK